MAFGKSRRANASALVLTSFIAAHAAGLGSAYAQAPAAAGVQSAAAATESRLGGDRQRTRFVISLENAVQYQTFSLADPSRVVIETPDVKMQLPVHAGEAPVGLVRSFRGGLSAPGRARVVIDTTVPAMIEKVQLDKAKDGKGVRLTLEIVPLEAQTKPAAKKASIAPPTSGLGAAGLPPPPQVAIRRNNRQANEYKPLIVIDPGHGGHDSGAKKFGTVEKDVVLAFSLKLREKLLATGRYQVKMTRETDVFVELDDRREFGDKNKAHLFIAVHADYASTSARGATIYSLKENTAKELQRSAKGEATEDLLSAAELEKIKRNDVDGNAAPVVRSFLSDLAIREVATNKDRSNLFTRSVIEFMGASTNLMENPDREANFRVLKSGKTPSVLIELAYVTNQQDAENLKSDSWRDRVSGSILTAIENYFSHQIARLPM